jgi:16S rRNA (uracil1498-N3)-methyltransferase
MHRFFVPPEAVQGGELVLEAGQARQIYDVLRLRPGEQIAVFDNSGAEYHVELVQVERRRVRGRIVESVDGTSEPHTQLVLYQCVLKADRFEWVLQKCTELGVAEFVPVLSARVIAGSVGGTKLLRWERILIEAAEQAARSKIPVLHPVQRWTAALAEARRRGGPALIPWEEERKTDLRTELPAGEPVHLFIGPEGGFEPGEVQEARDSGIKPVTLGPRILRAETASLVAATAIFLMRGELDAY